MLIRAAHADDAEVLATLCGQLGYPCAAPAIARRLPDSPGVVLVAVDAEGVVCGFAQAEPRRLVMVEAFVELTALVVDDACRGRGVGASLLAAVEAWARQQGSVQLRLRSNVVRERAHRFYRRAGYVETKRQAVFDKRI